MSPRPQSAESHNVREKLMAKYTAVSKNLMKVVDIADIFHFLNQIQYT